MDILQLDCGWTKNSTKAEADVALLGVGCVGPTEPFDGFGFHRIIWAVRWPVASVCPARLTTQITRNVPNVINLSFGASDSNNISLNKSDV